MFGNWHVVTGGSVAADANGWEHGPRRGRGHRKESVRENLSSPILSSLVLSILTMDNVDFFVESDGFLDSIRKVGMLW